MFLSPAPKRILESWSTRRLADAHVPVDSRYHHKEPGLVHVCVFFVNWSLEPLVTSDIYIYVLKTGSAGYDMGTGVHRPGVHPVDARSSWR